MQPSIHPRRGAIAIALVGAAFGSAWALGHAQRPATATAAAQTRPIPLVSEQRIAIPALEPGGRLPALAQAAPAGQRRQSRIPRGGQGQPPVGNREHPAGAPSAPSGKPGPTTAPHSRAPRPATPRVAPRNTAPPPAPRTDAPSAPMQPPAPPAPRPPSTNDEPDSYDIAEEGW